MLIQYMQEKRPEGLGNEGGKEEDVSDLQVPLGGLAGDCVMDGAVDDALRVIA